MNEKSLESRPDKQGSIENQIEELDIIINNLNEEIERSEQLLVPILRHFDENKKQKVRESMCPLHGLLIGLTENAETALLRLNHMNNRIEL